MQLEPDYCTSTFETCRISALQNFLNVCFTDAQCLHFLGPTFRKMRTKDFSSFCTRRNCLQQHIPFDSTSSAGRTPSQSETEGLYSSECCALMFYLKCFSVCLSHFNSRWGSSMVSLLPAISDYSTFFPLQPIPPSSNSKSTSLTLLQERVNSQILAMSATPNSVCALRVENALSPRIRWFSLFSMSGSMTFWFWLATWFSQWLLARLQSQLWKSSPRRLLIYYCSF